MNLHLVIADASYDKQLFEMEKTCFPSEYWSFESIKSELLKENSVCIIASHDGDFAGYVFSSFVCDESELNRIAVLPKYRNKKIGVKMLEHLIDILSKRDCKNLFLEVRETNCAAINLYIKSGFKKIGIRNNYYANPTENAVLMSLKI